MVMGTSQFYVNLGQVPLSSCPTHNIFCWTTKTFSCLNLLTRQNMENTTWSTSNNHNFWAHQRAAPAMTASSMMSQYSTFHHHIQAGLPEIDRMETKRRCGGGNDFPAGNDLSLNCRLVSRWHWFCFRICRRHWFFCKICQIEIRRMPGQPLIRFTTPNLNGCYHHDPPNKNLSAALKPPCFPKKPRPQHFSSHHFFNVLLFFLSYYLLKKGG